MKTAVIYYSLEGNTEFIAKKIAEKTQGDMIKLVPDKQIFLGWKKCDVWRKT